MVGFGAVEGASKQDVETSETNGTRSHVEIMLICGAFRKLYLFWDHTALTQSKIAPSTVEMGREESRN